MSTAIHGTCADGFEGVRSAFARCFDTMGEVGAATCVYLDGRPVVSLWGGHADPISGTDWQHDTLVNLYSATKPMAALCLLLLVDRQLVELDAPVARYWPEFAQAGKGEIPVRWLLTHQSGLLSLREPQPADAIFDWDRITHLLAAEAPWWQPGELHGEHAYFFGHLIGEVVRRVCGKSLGAFFQSEIAGSWGLDAHIGLGDREIARCARVNGLDDDWRANLGLVPGSLRHRVLSNPPNVLDLDTINGDAWRRAQVPAVNGHATAHAMARLYGALASGGTLHGVRVFSEALIADATSTHASGNDYLLEFPVRWGLGFMIDVDGFGMGGLGGSLGWGNLEKRLGFAYTTNRMWNHDRAMSVYRAAAAVLGLKVP